MPPVLVSHTERDSHISVNLVTHHVVPVQVQNLVTARLVLPLKYYRQGSVRRVRKVTSYRPLLTSATPATTPVLTVQDQTLTSAQLVRETCS